MGTEGRPSKHFLRYVAILLIHICVVNSQGLPQDSDMIVEFNQTDAHLDHVREKRDALILTARTTSSATTKSTDTATSTTNSTTPTNTAATTRNSMTTHATMTNSTTINSSNTAATTTHSTTMNFTNTAATTTNTSTTNSSNTAATRTNSTTTNSPNIAATTTNSTTTNSPNTAATRTNSTTTNSTNTVATTTNSTTTNSLNTVATTTNSTTTNSLNTVATTTNSTTTNSSNIAATTTNSTTTNSPNITATRTNSTTTNSSNTAATTTSTLTTNSSNTAATRTNSTTTNSLNTVATTTNSTTTNSSNIAATTTNSTITNSPNITATRTNSTTTNSSNTAATTTNTLTTNSSNTAATRTNSTTTNSLNTVATTTNSTTTNSSNIAATTTNSTITNSPNTAATTTNSTTTNSSNTAATTTHSTTMNFTNTAATTTNTSTTNSSNTAATRTNSTTTNSPNIAATTTNSTTTNSPNTAATRTNSTTTNSTNTVATTTNSTTTNSLNTVATTTNSTTTNSLNTVATTTNSTTTNSSNIAATTTNSTTTNSPNITATRTNSTTTNSSNTAATTTSTLTTNSSNTAATRTNSTTTNSLNTVATTTNSTTTNSSNIAATTTNSTITNSPNTAATTTNSTTTNSPNTAATTTNSTTTNTSNTAATAINTITTNSSNKSATRTNTTTTNSSNIAATTTNSTITNSPNITATGTNSTTTNSSNTAATTTNTLTTNSSNTAATRTNSTTTNSLNTVATTTNSTTTNSSNIAATTTNSTITNSPNTAATTTNSTTTNSSNTAATTTHSTTMNFTNTAATTTNTSTTNSSNTAATRTNSTTTNSPNIAATTTNSTTTNSPNTAATRTNSTTTNSTNTVATTTNSTTTNSLNTVATTTNSTTTNSLNTVAPTTNSTTTNSSNIAATTTNSTTTNSPNITATRTNSTTTNSSNTAATTTSTLTTNSSNTAATRTNSTTTNSLNTVATTTNSTTTNSSNIAATTTNSTITNSPNTAATTTNSTTTNSPNTAATTTNSTTTNTSNTAATAINTITTNSSNKSATRTNTTTINSSNTAATTTNTSTTNSSNTAATRTNTTTTNSPNTAATTTNSTTTNSSNTAATTTNTSTTNSSSTAATRTNTTTTNSPNTAATTTNFTTTNSSNIAATRTNSTSTNSPNTVATTINTTTTNSISITAAATNSTNTAPTSTKPTTMKFTSTVATTTNFTTTVTPNTVLPNEYLMDIDIYTRNIVNLNLLQNILETLSLPLINTNINVTEINITTVCILSDGEYQCMCEDQYFWPYEMCIVYGACDDSMDGLCGCINAIPSDGQFCQPISELTMLQTEYLLEIEINTMNIAELNFLKKILEILSLPLINSNIHVTEINITTVCTLSDGEYQCMCEDQYFWPYEMCIVYGACDDSMDGLCGCINAIPSDGQFCQPISELTMPQTEYLLETEINAMNKAVLNVLKNILETLSLPLIDSNIHVAEINITTVCSLNGTEYQCRCEDQYVWPYEMCTVYGSCDDITDGSCGCISALPNDGHFCKPIMPQTEYLLEIDINTMTKEVLKLLKNMLEALSLPLINSDISVTELNITTVCLLNGTEYQCRCEDRHLWPCEKCTLYGSCDYNASGSCGCINAIPNDGHFCQPISEMMDMSPCTTVTHVISFSLKINEEFNFALSNTSSGKYKKYTNAIVDSINGSYSSVSAYKVNSATVTGFRPGSVIADFNINAASDNLDLVSANQQVIAQLRNQGYNISDDAFSRTVKDGLYQSRDQIYPENNLTLTCNTKVNDSITWKKNGYDLVPSDRILIFKTTLVVKETTPNDSGVYECRTTMNSMPYVIWQSIMIPEPNIQVNSSKDFECGNITKKLQCCVEPSYNVTWISSRDCSEKVEENGCIYCDYNMTESECNANDQIMTVICTLTESDYSKSIRISAVNRKFECSDDAFGVGNVGENKTGDCHADMIGYQIARCDESGDWIVTYDSCILPVIKYLKDRSQNLLVIDLPKFAHNVSNATTAHVSEIARSPATILTIVELLKTISDLSQSVTIPINTMRDFLQILDVIGSAEALHAWLQINSNGTTMMKSSELLTSIERIVRRLPPESFDIATNYTSLKKNKSITNGFNETFGINSTTQISIPVTIPWTSLTVIISLSLNIILPVRNQTYNDNSQTGTTLNGDVAVIEPNSTINSISLSFALKNKTLGSPQCVFWNVNLLNGIGGWDPTGCQLKPLGNESERYTCECNHTTSFSILMSPFPPDTDNKKKALDIITYIGVGISMASLVLCLIIEIIIWKSVTKNETSYMRHVSVVNIAVSLLIANICFIIGAAVVKKGVEPCSTVTFFMHFFYLALFFWMLLSALLLLYRTLMVFSRMSKGTMMAIAFTVGYGAPLIIAVITVASTAGSEGYIQKDYNCWLNWNKTKALLAFVIPALTIVAINLLVLIVVLCKMLKRRVNASIQPDEKHPLVVIARCVGILTPLFGLTWGFGIGTMVSSNFGIHVVFAFLNSLQGFFILLFGTLLDQKVREALARKLAHANISSNRTRSTSTGPSS
ncbi:uncharacterized protein LOC132873038 [Neoarius graeffei]|uniref:uncharacterized protein LOC132873038 n=1 Tax=Neoarius graeffei TaxID=443677 RepID=UPI00298C534D|nr:uncharacterized protein LOC132873038 [Neoarius graeffei]